MLSKDTRSISDLFGEVVEQFGHLIRTEVHLAQAELSEKVKEASTGLVLVVTAGVLMIPAIVMALAALALWLAQIGVARPLAFLVSAAVGGVLSIVFLTTGLSRLKLKRLKLSKTAEQIGQDFAAARRLAE